jgi:anti-anti-sigma regulatory factor
MRRTGLVETVEGLGSHDHICWAFDTPGEFRSPAARFLSDGLASRERVIYIADGARESDLEPFDGFAEAFATGAAQVQDLGIYGSGWQDDPSAQVLAYAEATDQALAEGYSGLRVAAEATPLVRTPRTRALFSRYEHLIDVFMTQHRFSAMCAYDRTELGPAAIAELACLHPLARPSSTAMRLYAPDRPETAATLAGEVDVIQYDQLRTALSSIDFAPADGEVAIDARELSFIDHRALILLVDDIRSRGARTVLHVDERSVVRPLANLLRLPDLRVVMS